jgi:hypothetical protein
MKGRYRFKCPFAAAIAVKAATAPSLLLAATREERGKRSANINVTATRNNLFFSSEKLQLKEKVR